MTQTPRWAVEESAFGKRQAAPGKSRPTRLLKGAAARDTLVHCLLWKQGRASGAPSAFGGLQDLADIETVAVQIPERETTQAGGLPELGGHHAPSLEIELVRAGIDRLENRERACPPRWWAFRVSGKFPDGQAAALSDIENRHAFGRILEHDLEAQRRPVPGNGRLQASHSKNDTLDTGER